MKQHYSIFKASLLLAILLLSQNLSSQCKFGFETTNTDVIGEVNPTDPIKYAQGFTAECSGLLEYVQFKSSGSGTLTSGIINVYSGNGTTGTPIYSKIYAEQTIVDGRRPIRVEITETLEVEKDKQYTFQLQFNSQLGIVAATGNQYSGGFAFQNENAAENFDFFFDVSITEKSLSVNDIDSSLKLVLLPNPSKDYVRVSNLNDSKKYQIFNVLGKQVSKGFMTNNEKIDIKSFSLGIYFLKLEGGTTFKFLKN